MSVIRTGSKFEGVRVFSDENIKPDIIIYYYPYYIHHGTSEFDAKDSDYFVELSNKECVIEVYEAFSRPLSDWPEIVDIILTFISFKILDGFFNNFGSDVYHKIKSKIKTIAPIRKDGKGRDVKTGIHICYPRLFENKKVKIKVAIKIDDLDKLNMEPFTLKSINKFIDSIFNDIDFQEVLIAKTDEYPYWKVVSFIDSKGKYIKLK